MKAERIARLLAEGRLTPAQVGKAAALGLVPPNASPTTDVSGAQANLVTLHQQAEVAFVDNRTFANRANASNPQLLAQVKALSRQMNGTLRLLFDQYDATD